MPPKRRGGKGRGRGGPPAAAEEKPQAQQSTVGRARASTSRPERQGEPSSGPGEQRFYQPPHQRRAPEESAAGGEDVPTPRAGQQVAKGSSQPASHGGGRETRGKDYSPSQSIGGGDGPSESGARPKQSVVPTGQQPSHQEITGAVAALKVSSGSVPPSTQHSGDKLAVQPFKFHAKRAVRPGYSSDCKKKIKIVSNLYRLGCDKATVYHYEVDISAKDQKKFDKALPKPLCHKVLFQWVRQCRLEGIAPAFDGSKALYTSQPLPWDGERSFDVDITDGDKTKSFNLAVKPVKRRNTGTNAVDVGAVMKYVQGKSTVIPEEVRMVLETILSYRRPDSTQTAMRNTIFYSSQVAKRWSLGGGAEMWVGYSQNIRFTEKGAAIVINTAAAAFYKEGPVIQLLPEILNLRRNLDYNTALNEKECSKLAKKLKGLNVCVTHQRHKRKYRIEKLSEKPATHLTFQMDGNDVTVQDYFLSQYNMRLRFPRLPCLKMVSSKSMNVYMPLEVCEVLPNQRIKGTLDSAMTAAMIKRTALPPSEKFRRIQGDAENLEHNVPLQTYGLDLQLQPVETTARILYQPCVEYQREVECNLRDNGVWDMRNLNFSTASSANNVELICFAADCKMQVLQKFSSLLCHAASSVGMNFGRPSIRICGPQISTQRAIDDAKKRKLDLVIVVLSNYDAYHSYEEVKFWADIKYGIPSQCVSQKVVESDRMDMRTACNICLKINTKMGGVNHKISEWPIAFHREAVLIMGADVIHHHRDEFPSIAAVIGCVDEGISKYAVACKAMLNPKSKKAQEIIVDIKDMTRKILLSYYRNNGKRKPQKILFYRDGISEGQFQDALDIEIPKIKEACSSLQPDYKPPITYVIVQKRHPVRIRPKIENEGIGRGKNVPPGTIADRDIVDPHLFEFYLCSHEGIQGTSKPTRYVVLFDENRVQPNIIESATYYLCHVFARCNRSISIPAPVKYADLLCTRASDYVKVILSRRGTRPPPSPEPLEEVPKDIEEVIESIENIGNSMFFI